MSNQSNEINKLAAEQFLLAIDEFASPAAGSTRNVHYELNTRPFKSKRIIARIINKLSHAPLFILKRSFSEYLWNKSLTDASLLKDSKFVSQKIIKIENEVDTLAEKTSRMLDQKIYEVMKLNDMLKSELMAEINKDQSPVGAEDKIQTKWQNPKAKNLSRLNVGSGSFLKEGYINIDHRAIKGVDLICDIRDLPFSPGTIKEIYSSHVVEHFTEMKVKEMLSHWYELLTIDGKLRIIVPDINSMAKSYAANDLSWERLRKVILGGQDYNSDYHFNVFSKEYLVDLLTEIAPDAKVSVLAEGRPNGEALELDVEVVKVSKHE